MTDNTILPFAFPAVHTKKVTAAFDGGRLTSNGGVMLLAMAERRLGLADNLARVFPDRRDPTRVVHSLVDMFRARMFAICCGYEDADDLDHLRSDPAFKLACGRLPDTGRDLCSQPTLSRLENAPRLRDVIRLTYTLVDAWMDSYRCEPASVTLDIDDTCDVVHGHQQLSLFIGAYLRWRLSDTPKFTEIEEQGDTSSRPFLEAITKYPTETLTVFGLTLHFTVAYYIVIVFLTQHIVSVAGLTPANAQWISVSGLVVFVVIIPLWGALSDKIGRKIFLQVSTLGYVLLAYPLFMMATSGSSTLALIAQLTFVVLLSAFAGPAPATFSEMFPTRVRCTAQSIGNNLAVAIFGGFAPLISTWLIKITGDNLAPSYYLMAAAAVSFLVSLRLKETAFSELK